MNGLYALALVALLGIELACDRNIEPFEPGEEAKPPDLARIFPAPIGEQMGEGEAAGVQNGPVARGALPPSRSEGSGGAAAGAQARATATAPIRGEIDLAEAFADARPPGAVLFVIARPVGVTRGPPLAVLRIPDPTFPLSFEIGPAQVMIPSMRFEGQIALSARLDADGNAMTRTEGDISSAVAAPLEPGAEGVRLILSES